MLVLQSIIPLALITESKIHGKILGGTEVKWSPTFDYFNKIFIKGLQKTGIYVSLKLERSGYYPEGGGIVRYEIQPCNKLRGLNIVNLPEDLEVEGISRCSHLPEDIAKRQAESAKRILQNFRTKVSKIETILSQESLSKGSSITLWLNNESTLVGGDSIGERGKRAEEVGKEAANKIGYCLSERAPVDEHAADMIFPYLIFANEESRMAIPKISSHLETEIFIARYFKNFNFSFSGSSPIIFKIEPSLKK
jgi:RNA 3'-terminal phosphate cyclase (ATP)